MNKTILKLPSLQRQAPNTYTWDFPDVIKFLVAAHTISEKAKVLASGSGSKVNQFVHVPTSFDIQHFIQIHSIIFRSVYKIDMNFDRQLRPATETSWVVSYGGKTILRWRTAAILKIDISPYLVKNNPIFMNFVHSISFWTGWTSRDQKWKSCIQRP